MWTRSLCQIVYTCLLLILLADGSNRPLVSLVHAGVGNCLQSLDVYFISTGNQFIPGMDITNLTSVQSFTGPDCFACGNPPIIEVPAMTNRVFLKIVYEETSCLDAGASSYGPIVLIDDLTGNVIRSNASYELPYKIPTSYGIDTTSNEYFFVTTFSTSRETLTIQWYGNGWNVNGVYWANDFHLTAVAGQATQFYIRPQTISYPLNQPITYDLSIPSGAGRVDQMQITFTPDPTLTIWMYLIFSALWTAPQAQTILLIATRNYTVSPLNQADDERFGSSFTIPIQIVHNAVCGQGLESGHFVFGSAAGSTSPPIQWKYPTLTSWTACFFMKPEFANGQTQVWFDLGSLGHELQAGIMGNDAAANGGPMGAFFMRDLVTGDVNIATPVGSSSGSSSTWNFHLWYHICFVYYGGDGGVNHDGGNNHEKLMHIFVNGIPASAPTLLSTVWTDPIPLYAGATQITIGGRPDGSLPASGGFDEFVFYSRPLAPLEVYYGYQTSAWLDYTGLHPATTWYFDQPGILGLLGLGSGYYDPSVSFTNGDTLCSALSQQMGSFTNLTGSNCVQPFRYDALKSANGRSSKNDGQLQVAIDGSVTTGGATFIGAINTNLTGQSILSCVWVNRYNTPPDTQQTIFSIGSFNHTGSGLITVSYFNDNIQLTLGAERIMDTIQIPLSWDNEYASFSNWDSQLWVHWCFHLAPANVDYYQPTPYMQLFRNGRWWYRTSLKGGEFQSSVIPIVQPIDNVVCIGCTVSSVNVFPLQGGLDEYWLMVQPYIGYMNDYMVQSFATDSWFINGALQGFNPPIVWLRFNETVGSTLTSLVFTNPLNETGLVTSTFTIYTGSSANSWTSGDSSSLIGFTCVVLAPAIPTTPAIVQQFGSRYPATTGGSFAPIEFVEIRPELNQTLILPTHAFIIADHDFSLCYWVKRASMVSSSPLTYYDISIGSSPALWIGSYVNSSTEYFSFSFGTSIPLQVPASNVQGSLDQQHWLYICGTYASITQNGVQGATRKLYRNGQLLGQDLPSSDFRSSAPIRIGARADDVLGTGGPQFYDEIAIFTSVITTQQILDYFNIQSYGVSPVIRLSFQASLLIGHSFQSAVGGELFQCTGTQPCGYHSFGPTDSEAVNSPAVELLVPQVCPGDYYADGSLAITTRDYNPVSGLQDLHTGSGPLLYTDSLNSAFVGTDFSFSIWFRLESNQPDASNTTIFEVGCPGSTYQLSTTPLNQQIIFNANRLIGLHSTIMTPDIGIWVLVMGVYYVATDSIDLYRFDGTTLQSTSTDGSSNIHYLNCPTGINAILGGFSNYSNFNGMLDEFRVWNVAITNDLNNLEYLSVGRVDYLNPYTAPTLKDRLNLQNGLQIYLPFSEQTGTTAFSYHNQPAALITNLTAFSATSQNSSLRELQWFSPGITNYYDNFDYGLVNGNGVTPATEYSIHCTPALLPSPIFIQSAELSRTGVQYMTDFASVDFIFLQTVGPQGLTVLIDAPAGVTVSPNTFIYGAGSASRQASTVPNSFNLTFTRAQYVTLWFRFIGPEALHLKRYQITPPSFDFPIYADLWRIDLSCSMLTQVSATAYSFSPPSPVFTNKTDIFNHGDKTLQPLFTSTETQLNWCEFTIARFNSSMMGSVTLTAPDGIVMTSPTAFSVWQVGFYVPLGDSYPTITSPKDGAYSSHFFRSRSSVQHSVVVATPTDFLHGVPSSINVTIPATIHFNVTIIPFLTQNGSVVPPSLVFLPPSDAHSFTFTMDVTHPAITYVTIILPLTGYGANDDLFPITPITLLNTYQLSNAFLLSASFTSVNITTIDVPLFGALTPVSGAFDVPLLNYQVGSDILVTLQFDQWLSRVKYQLVTNSSVTTLPPSFSTTATTLDASIGIPRPLAIAFNVTNLSLSDNMLFIETISSDSSVSQLWVFNLTLVVPSTVTFPIVNGTATNATATNATATNATVSNPDNHWTDPIPDSPLQVDGSCLGAQNPCLYGSECVVNRTSSSSPPSCICSPFFRGPLCQFAILNCIGCVIPAPSKNTSSPPIYANLTLIGLAFDRIHSVKVGSLLIQPSDFLQFAPIMANNSLLQSVFTRQEFDSSITVMSQGFFVLRLQIDVNRVGINISALTTTQAPPKVKNTYSHNTQLLVTTPTGDHYIPVTFELIFSAAETTKFPYLIYQSWYTTCLEVGQWKPDPNNPSVCLSCPEGGECPGGGVVYPLPGWWSPNEFTAPVHCELDDESCPGLALPPLSYDPSGHVDTQLCSVGYNGTVCGSCAGNYYLSGLRCFPCASHASESAQLAGLLLFGVCILCFLSVIVAVAKSESLATLVALFILLQQTIATGKASSQTWPKSLQPLSDFLLTISIVNFDITFLKSGCVTPTYSFIGTFYGTLLLVLIAFLMFYIACQCRKHWLLMRLSKSYAAQNAAMRRRVNDKKDDELFGTAEVNHYDEVELTAEETAKLHAQRVKQHQQAVKQIRLGYERRLIHARFILCSLFYLKLTTLELNGLNCHQVPRSTTLVASTDPSSLPTDLIYVLRSDSSLECWQGGHLVTVIIILILLVGFSFGFPIICVRMLTRAFAPILLRDARHSTSLIGRLLQFLGYQLPSKSTSTLDRPTSIQRVGSLMTPSNGPSASEELDQAEKVAKQQRDLHTIHMELFGYLFRNLKDERYFFRLLSFPISLGFTFTLVFVTDVQLRTFILGFLYAFNALLHCNLIPFIKWRSNFISSGIQLFSLIYTIGVLALMKGPDVNTYTMWLGFVSLFVAVQYVILVVGSSNKKQSNSDEQLDKEHSEETLNLTEGTSSKQLGMGSDDQKLLRSDEEKIVVASNRGPRENERKATSNTIILDETISPIPQPSPQSNDGQIEMLYMDSSCGELPGTVTSSTVRPLISPNHGIHPTSLSSSPRPSPSSSGHSHPHANVLAVGLKPTPTNSSDEPPIAGDAATTAAKIV